MFLQKQHFLVKISTHKNMQKEVKVTQLVSTLFQIIPSLFPSRALYAYSLVSTYIGSYPLHCISNDVGLTSSCSNRTERPRGKRVEKGNQFLLSP